jgi:predicted NBD/HSP70 family sugar kinase
MFRTGNLGLVKKINKYTVLNIIRDKQLISRAEISKVAGLNKATVSSLVDELIAENYVLESGIGVSTGGRRPLMLKFNVDAGSLVGVELGVNYIYVVLTDLNAHILWEKKVNLDPKIPQQDIIEEMISLIKAAIAKAPESPYGVLGIGVGVPGIVNTDQGTIVFAPNLNWDNVSLNTILKHDFPDIYITVDNEAKLGAIGEKWFGAGREYKNIVYISAGVGIGAGIIINDQLYSGIEGIAGEIGHTTIEINGQQCSCGNRGCWEMYASEKFIRNRLRESNRASVVDIDEITVEDILQMANRGDDFARELLHEVGTYLGIGIQNIINSYNPEAVIVGNTIGAGKEWILGPARAIATKRVLTRESSYPHILNSELDEQSCVIGAVSSILDKVLNPSEISLVSHHHVKQPN